jgi:hypothetical protein
MRRTALTLDAFRVFSRARIEHRARGKAILIGIEMPANAQPHSTAQRCNRLHRGAPGWLARDTTRAPFKSGRVSMQIAAGSITYGSLA